jgi:hypothetical protein
MARRRFFNRVGRGPGSDSLVFELVVVFHLTNLFHSPHLTSGVYLKTLTALGY